MSRPAPRNRLPSLKEHIKDYYARIITAPRLQILAPMMNEKIVNSIDRVLRHFIKEIGGRMETSTMRSLTRADLLRAVGRVTDDEYMIKAIEEQFEKRPKFFEVITVGPHLHASTNIPLTEQTEHAMTMVVEYMAHEILSLAANGAIDRGDSKVRQGDVDLAIDNDPALKQMLRLGA